MAIKPSEAEKVISKVHGFNSATSHNFSLLCRVFEINRVKGETIDGELKGTISENDCVGQTKNAISLINGDEHAIHELAIP